LKSIKLFYWNSILLISHNTKCCNEIGNVDFFWFFWSKNMKEKLLAASADLRRDFYAIIFLPSHQGQRWHRSIVYTEATWKVLVKRKDATELDAVRSTCMREKRAPFAHANARRRVADLPRLIFVNINYGTLFS